MTVTQTRINFVNQLYQGNITLTGDALSKFMAEGFFSPNYQHGEDKIQMLASSSKPLLDWVLAQQLYLDSQIPVDIDMLIELVHREPMRVKMHPEMYAQLMPAYRVAQLMHWLRRGPGRGKLILPLRPIDNLLQTVAWEMLGGKTLPIEEVFYQSLGQSSNASTTKIKELAEAIVGDFTNLQALYTQLAPSFKATRSTKNYQHWVQPDPNTGKITEMMDVLFKLVSRVEAGMANPLEQVLVESMTNNHLDFKFCFTHSELGQELIAKGWRVVEKTGYYPVVFWVEKLAELGYPPHMILNNVVVLISPDGQMTPFSQYMMTEVVPPFDPMYDQGMHLLNDWATGYQNRYILPVLDELQPEYRQKQTNSVLQIFK